MKTLMSAVMVIVMLASVAGAEIKTQIVDYKIGDTSFKGFLAYDDAVKEKQPGVLVVHEWWGRNAYVDTRATELARLGYVAFAVDMYGDGKTTTDPKQAGEWATAVKGNTDLARERMKAGLEQLKSNPQVDAAKIASIGYCFGGTMSLELARSGADVQGVVSFHGGLATQKPAEAGNFKARVLVCHGAADTFVSEEEVAKFKDEMNKADAVWEINEYSGAVHAFTNPDADKFNIPGIAYNATADQRSWDSMQEFFKEIFGATK